MSVQAESRFDVRVSKKPLNRLHVRSLIDQPTRQSVPEIVEAESLPFFELHPSGNCCRSEMVPSQDAARPRCLPFVPCAGKDPIAWPSVDRFPLPVPDVRGQQIGERYGGLGVFGLHLLHDCVADPHPTKVDLLVMVVNILPLQAHRFADAYAGCRDEDRQGQFKT